MRAFACLCGIDVEELNLFPETEPSAFVGQFQPTSQTSETDTERIKWENGVVTRAWCDNTWVLLENLSQADARCCCTTLRVPASPERPALAAV
jgi:hypothetical protein